MDRTRQLKTTDCSDSIRVVNSLLTALDGMLRYNNVFLIFTSNLVSGIDAALLDRVDRTWTLPLPPPQVAIQIVSD